jgi:hypothetical protein
VLSHGTHTAAIRLKVGTIRLGHSEHRFSEKNGLLIKILCIVSY